MDQVKTFSFNEVGDVRGQSASDIFNAFSQKSPEPATDVAVSPASPDANIPTPSTLSAQELLANMGKTPETSPVPADEEENKPEEGEDDAAVVTPVAEPAKGGRPVEKLSEFTQKEILALIEDGVLEGFEDAKYESQKDLKELLEANKTKWKEETQSQLEQSFLQSLNPAMQFIAQYAQHVQSPADLRGLLDAMDNVDYVASFDVENPDDQEMIIRQYNNIKGVPPETIEADIADLKERGKLAERAKTFKPALDQFTQQQLQQVQYQKQQELIQEQQFWNQHQNEVKQAVIDAKAIDGYKFKNDHKELAFAALSQRNQEGDLYIYSLVDNLLAKKDFETLSLAAILMADKKALKNYIQSEQKAADAKETIRSLKSRDLNTNNSIAGTHELPQEKKGLPRPTRSGFGW